MSNPDPVRPEPTSPLFVAPTGSAPDVTREPDAPIVSPRQPTSLVFTSPDLEGSPSNVSRAKFLARVVAQDEDIRVLATALRLRGYNIQTIAVGLDVSQARVRRALKQARIDGNLADVLQDLTTEALPLAVEKLIDKLHEGDWKAIRETLRGTGAFRTYSQQDGTTIRDERKLEVKFTLPKNAAVPTMNPRGIVGAPREVIDATVQEVGQQEATGVGPLAHGPA